MKKTPLRKVSPKQGKENQRRSYIHRILWEKQEGLCKKCGRYLHYYQSELVHKDNIGMGGCKDNTKTTEKDCDVRCKSSMSGCHPNAKHGLRNKYNEMPQWSR